MALRTVSVINNLACRIIDGEKEYVETSCLAGVTSLTSKAQVQHRPCCGSASEHDCVPSSREKGPECRRADLADTVRLQWVYVPPKSSYAFLCLGADCTISFRSSASARKKDRASVKAWHGDLVIVRTYENGIEVGLRAEGLTYCESRERPMRRRNAHNPCQSASAARSTRRKRFGPTPSRNRWACRSCGTRRSRM